MNSSPLFALLDRLQWEGFKFALEAGHPRVAPVSSLNPEERAFLSSHREVLAQWLTFPDARKAIIRRTDPVVTLDRLIR